MVAEEFAKKLIPLDMDIGLVTIMFTRVEFASGNEKATINLSEFTILGLTMTGHIFTHDAVGDPAAPDFVERLNMYCGPRPGHKHTEVPVETKWGIRILVNVYNVSIDDLRVLVLSAELIKCPFNLSDLIAEDALKAALSQRLADVISRRIEEHLGVSYVRQLAIGEDDPKPRKLTGASPQTSPRNASGKLTGAAPHQTSPRTSPRNASGTPPRTPPRSPRSSEINPHPFSATSSIQA